MNLTQDILKEFKTITNQDVEVFFAKCIVFFNGNYNKIVAFYSGTITTIERGAFDELTNLENECEVFFSVFQQMQNRLGNLKWWEVLEHLEIIDLRLKSLRKINKWSRSSLTNVAYDPALQATYTLKPKQTLERVAQDILERVNPQDDWVDIAVSNQLKEEDYTVNGGVDLQLSFPKINRGVQITSVVDVMISKAIYGKDLDRIFHFDEDEEDIAVLDYDATIHQSVEVLANLKKNDDPDFPTDGLQREVAIGGNRAALNFPVINRQMTEAFDTDDSVKNFQITLIAVDQNVLNIEFQVETRLDETKEGNVLI